MRLKLILAFCLTSALSAGIVGIISMRHSYAAFKAQKQQDELMVARNIAVQVDETLRKARQTVEILAKNPDIQSEDKERQNHALSLVAEVTELFDGFIITNPKGEILFIDGAQPDTHRLLPESTYDKFVRPTIAARGSNYSEIYQSRSGELAVGINIPIYAGGKMTKILTGGILLKNHTMGGIDAIRVGKSGYAYLVDSVGTVIMHPQSKRLLENYSDLPPVQELLHRKEGISEFVNKEGIMVLAAFAPISETGWGVVVRQPSEESYEAANSLLKFLLTLFGVVLAASVGVGVMLARRISKPIMDLENAIVKISSGDLRISVPVQGSDELARLSRCVNLMSVHLIEHIATIEAAHKKIMETQTQLARSEKLAALGQVAASLAHEIQNPLTIISGFCEVLLAKTAAGSKEKEYLLEMHRETLRCQRLVKDLLYLSKPKIPAKTPVDIHDLVGRSLELVKNRADTAGVGISAALDAAQYIVTGDTDQITQVFLNIFINALETMPNGGTLSVSTSNETPKRLLIAIADTGPGIAKDNLENIFLPFFSTKEAGTGLGLAVSHSIIQNHGGSIAAANTANGAVFYLELPLHETAYD